MFSKTLAFWIENQFFGKSEILYLPEKWPIEIPGISSSFVFGWLGPLALVQNSRFLVCLPILGASREVFVSKKREVYSYCFKGGGWWFLLFLEGIFVKYGSGRTYYIDGFFLGK